MKYYLAIDIGASSGRHIVGWKENDAIKTNEVYRFPNGVKEEDGHLVWDTQDLFHHVKKGIDAALKTYPNIESLSIDTWGVDYVLLDHEKEILPVYTYRDHRTEQVIEEVHAITPFSELYARTGCQFQPFNSIYQLYADKKAGRLDRATELLMMPEYLMWKLCGGLAREYTNATTTGLINVKTGEFHLDLIRALGFSPSLFPKLQKPGTVIGAYRGIKVILCATHDTASAVEGIPMDGNFPYISSGTWSLIGVKTNSPITSESSRLANYSNEGGVGYNRYQKNIMGMWLINELKSELCPDLPFETIIQLAKESTCCAMIDANAPQFLAPKSMKAAFDAATKGALLTVGDYFSCAYRSLAESYRVALDELEQNTSCRYEKLYIVGGGAKNEYLNRLTEDAIDKSVIALPIEATALGNLKIQMEVNSNVLHRS